MGISLKWKTDILSGLWLFISFLLKEDFDVSYLPQPTVTSLREKDRQSTFNTKLFEVIYLSLKNMSWNLLYPEFCQIKYRRCTDVTYPYENCSVSNDHKPGGCWEMFIWIIYHVNVRFEDIYSVVRASSVWSGSPARRRCWWLSQDHLLLKTPWVA